MFEVSLTGADELCEKLDTFSNHIKSMAYTLPDEFKAWETQDMRRAHEHQKVRRYHRGGVRITTTIWERGIGSAPKAYQLKQAMVSYKHLRRPHIRHPRHHSGPQPWSTRPVLRPALKQMLYDRMMKVFKTYTEWP